MVDHPIIFSAPMVRALMDGRKTQTRRLLTQRNTLFDGRYARWPNWLHERAFKWADAWVDPGPSPAGNPGPYLKLPVIGLFCDSENPQEQTVHRIYPRIQPGDRLYVREAHAFDGPVVRYYATDDVHELRRKYPSIHMLRWASRLTLTVTEVRVQRLQDISEADADAEGAEALRAENGPPEAEDLRSYAWGFQTLWNSLHGADAWDANPWVIALTFTVQHGNIDKIGGAA